MKTECKRSPFNKYTFFFINSLNSKLNTLDESFIVVVVVCFSSIVHANHRFPVVILFSCRLSSRGNLFEVDENLVELDGFFVFFQRKTRWEFEKKNFDELEKFFGSFNIFVNCFISVINGFLFSLWISSRPKIRRITLADCIVDKPWAVIREVTQLLGNPFAIP